MTGEKGRATICWWFLGRAIFFKENHWRKTGPATNFWLKNWTDDKIFFLVDGRDRNIARPFIQEGCSLKNRCGGHPVKCNKSKK